MNSLDLKGRERFSSALINRSIFHRLRPYTEAENAALVMDLYGFDEGLANRLAAAHDGFVGATTRELKLAAKALKAGGNFDAIINKVYSLRCKQRLKPNTPLSVRTIQLVARALTPQRRIEGVKKDIAVTQFRPSDAPDKAGFFKEADYSFSLREGSESNPQELKGTIYHEMGHALLTRFSGDTPLHQTLEDFRMSYAQRTYNEGIGYLAHEEGLVTLCKSIISQDWVAILNTEPIAFFVNILAGYGLPETKLYKEDVLTLYQNILSTFPKLSKSVSKRLTTYIAALEFALQDDVYENARIAIASIPAKPKYATLPSEVEVQKASFIAHEARLKLEPYFNQIPRDLEQVKAKQESMMKQARREENDLKESSSSEIASILVARKLDLPKDKAESLTQLTELHRRRVGYGKIRNLLMPIQLTYSTSIQNHNQKLNHVFESLHQIASIRFNSFFMWGKENIMPRFSYYQSKAEKQMGLSIKYLSALRVKYNVPLIKSLKIINNVFQNASNAFYILGNKPDTSIHAETPLSLFEAARKRPEYQHFTDTELMEHCFQVLGRSMNERDIPVSVLSVSDDNAFGIIALDRQKRRSIEKGALRDKVTRRLVDVDSWMPSSMWMPGFKWGEQLNSQGRYLDPSQLLIDPNNAWVSNGGQQQRDVCPIIFSGSSLLTLSPIFIDAVDALIQKGVSVSVFTGKNQLVRSLSIFDFIQAVSIQNECDSLSLENLKRSNKDTVVINVKDFQDEVEESYMMLALEEEASIAPSLELKQNVDVKVKQPNELVEINKELENIWGQGSYKIWTSGLGLKLELLSVSDSQFIEASTFLEKYSNIDELIFSSPNMTDAIGPYLSKLTGLRGLYFDINTVFTNRLGTYIAELANLDSLEIDSKNMMGSYVSELKTLRSLEIGPNVMLPDNDTIGKWLSSLAKLEVLKLDNNQFTMEILPYIQKLCCLEIFSVKNYMLQKAVREKIDSKKPNYMSVEEIKLKFSSILDQGDFQVFLQLDNNIGVQISAGTDAQFKQIVDVIVQYPDIGEVAILSEHMSDEIGPDLVRLKGVRSLGFNNAQFSSKLGDYLLQLTRLESFTFNSPGMLGVYLSKLESIKELRIGVGVDVSDSILLGTWLSNLKHLNKLELLSESITSQVTPYVLQLPNLRFFYATNSDLNSPVRSAIEETKEFDKLFMNHAITLEEIFICLIHPETVREKLKEKFLNNDEALALLKRLFPGN